MTLATSEPRALADAAQSHPTAPAWSRGIVATAGFWEPLSFRRRQGSTSVNDDADFAAAHSEAMARQLANIGINSVIWHGYKGLGFEFEQEEMEQTRRFGEHCRKHGVHLGTYCNFGSFFNETFFKHMPEARKWLSRDQDGHPHLYSEFYRCYYRYRPCMTHAAYTDYVARMAVYLVEHVGSEWLSFDNNAMMPCYCEACQRAFRLFLKRRYPTDTPEGRARATQRFGYDYLDEIAIPRGTARMPVDAMPACFEPGIQEWVAYRCELLTKAFERLAEKVRATKRPVVVMVNPPVEAELVPLVWGNELEDLAPTTDYFFSEDGNAPRMDDDRLIGHFPTYKLARAFDRRSPVHQLTVPNVQRALFEAAVHNRGCLGHVAWADRLPAPDSELASVLHFIHDHAAWYTMTRSMADVAVLRGRHAMINNWADAYQSLLSTQQCLYRYGVQYDICLESQLENLHPYRLLILPNMISLPDTAMEAIRRYVLDGGAVLSIEQSGQCDDWNRSRTVSAIGKEGERDDSLGTVAAAVGGFAELLGLNIAHARRVVDFPTLDLPGRYRWSPTESWVARIEPKHWVMPANAESLIGTIRALLDEQMPLSLAKPATVAPQLLRADGETMLHLINYSDKPSEPMDIHLGFAVRRATGFTMENPGGVPIAVQTIDNGAIINAPAIESYMAVTLEE